MARFNIKEKFSIKNWIFWVVFLSLLVYGVFFIYLFAWGFMTSLKTDGDFILNKMGLPADWKFSNYIDVFNALVVKVTPEGTTKVLKYNAVNLIINSLLYAGGCTFFATLTPCIVAFCCACCKYKKVSRIIETAVIVVMVVPIIGQTPAQIEIAKTFGWYNKMYGIWTMNISFTNMFFLVFYAAFKTLTLGYAEAAFIDGAGWYTVFFRIYLPLVATTLSTCALLQFIGYWNAYEVPMMFVPDYPTLSLGLYWFKWEAPAGFKGMSYQITACYILLLPILVFFVLFRKKMMGNLTMGGLKG